MTATTQAPAKQQTMVRPFVAGTRKVDRQTYDQSTTLTTGTQDLKTYEVDPDGYLSALYVLVEAIASGNSATVAFKEDGPFSVIDTITLSDINNKPLVGPLGGHDLAMITKYGGYTFSSDPKQSPIYSVTTGSGGTGGSFTFALRLPVELSSRDGLGSLTNKSAAATFDLSVKLGASTAVYSTAPTALPTVRVRVPQVGWMDPADTDIKNNAVAQAPPASGTTQQWHKQTYNSITAGNNTNQRLNGIDALVRNFIFIFRDSSGLRSGGESDWPDGFDLQYETAFIVRSRLLKIWKHFIAEAYGYTGTVETAGGRDNGVFVLPFTQDFGLKPGNETRLGYLPVSSATLLAWSGTVGGSGAHQLNVLTNKVIPAGGNIVALAGR